MSIGGGQGGRRCRPTTFITPLDAHPERLAGRRAVEWAATSRRTQPWTLFDLRSADRVVAGGGPGPEGNVTKLVLSENGHEAAAMLAALTVLDGAFLDAPAPRPAMLVLMHRAMSIAAAHPRSSAIRSASAIPASRVIR